MYAFSQRANAVQGSSIRELFKLLADPEIISLGGGNPAKESFPIDDVRAICDHLLKTDGVNMLQYGVTSGWAPLRQAVIRHLLQPKGVEAAPENIVTTTGSTQGISLALEAFCDPGDVVLVENPTFLGTLNVMRKMGLMLHAVDMDENGILVDKLEEAVRTLRPKMLYTIPSFQNPTGRTIPADRRKRIAELAEEYSFIVIEDDPYGDVRFAGEHQPPIKHFDKSGNVILMNSFSKTISPGLRVGFACAAPEIAAKLEVLKQGADVHTSILAQAICAEYLERGLMPDHLVEVGKIYKERMEAMVSTMQRCFPKECSYTVPEGGLFLWVTLPGIDADALLKEAITKYKVAFVAGSQFCLDAAAGKECFRLNYSSSDAASIVTAVERLGQLLQEVR